jgi:hypothetical protein
MMASVPIRASVIQVLLDITGGSMYDNAGLVGGFIRAMCRLHSARWRRHP